MSLHGIRTRGAWQKSANSELGKDFTHAILDYDHFRALQLLIPPLRKRQVDWFSGEYERIVRDFTHPPSMIAHSFGAYIVAAALEKYPEIRFDRVILCGSIVRRDFDWAGKLSTGQVNAVLNESGGKDIWAQHVDWFVADAGSSGRNGFDSQADGLYERHNPLLGHSDHFYPLNVRENWIPFLNGYLPKDPPTEPSRRSNWRFGLAMVFIGLVVIATYLWARR